MSIHRGLPEFRFLNSMEASKIEDGTAGTASMVAQMMGGTGTFEFLPTMDDTRAEAYAADRLRVGEVYGDRADPNLLHGCKLLVLKGLAIHQRYNKIDTYYEAAFDGHPSGRTPTVEAYGARVDQLKAALGPDGFPVQVADVFSDEVEAN